MIVTATEFKNRVGVYLEAAQKEDVIITKNGKYAARLTTAGKNEHPLTENLVGVFEKAAVYDADNTRQERLKKYESAD